MSESADAPHTARQPPRLLRDFISACRPSQWTKSVFILAPVLFSERWFDSATLLRAALAVACFCLVSSAVYIINDLIDRDRDRVHPRKCRRPIAAGRIGGGAAVGLALGLLAVSVLGSLLLPRGYLACLAVYLVNSLLYCVVLKNKVIIDIIVISLGFILRLLAGCAAIGVVPSVWIVVCGFNLALVLGFGKRRAEVGSLDERVAFRPVLISYDRAKCDMLLAISTAVCLVSYTMYTVAPDTVALHRTDQLVYTTPVVAYGLFRYAFKTQEGAGDGPSEILAGDPVFFLTGLIWGALVMAILLLR